MRKGPFPDRERASGQSLVSGGRPYRNDSTMPCPPVWTLVQRWIRLAANLGEESIVMD